MEAGRQRPVVAIDGPAGAGKSTVARLLARRLGYVYVDTGAMYRAVALAARRAGIAVGEDESEPALVSLASGLRLEFRSDADPPRLLLNGEDVSEAIRAPDVSRASSEVSRWPGVRAAMVAQQRRLAAGGGVVMEGRDIGTVVVPDARVKIFLTATVDERARRRTLELLARGQTADPDQVRREIADRDRRDTERAHSPLRRAEDAVAFVTDGLTIDEVVQRLAALVQERVSG